MLILFTQNEKQKIHSLQATKNDDASIINFPTEEQREDTKSRCIRRWTDIIDIYTSRRVKEHRVASYLEEL